MYTKEEREETLLYEDSVDENEGEGDDEEDVGEVENKLGHVVLRAVSLHVPVGDSHLNTFMFRIFETV